MPSNGHQMKPRFFSSSTQFRRWLEQNHANATEIEVGFHKKSSGKKSITYAEAHGGYNV